MKLVAIVLAVRPVSLNFDFEKIMINFALSLDTFMSTWPSVREWQVHGANCESVHHDGQGMFAHGSGSSLKSALPSSRGIFSSPISLMLFALMSHLRIFASAFCAPLQVHFSRAQYIYLSELTEIFLVVLQRSRAHSPTITITA